MTDVSRGVQPKRDIVLLEVYLNALGYLARVDGRMDAETVAAVRRFQQEQGLVVDGIAGEKTWTKLFALKPELLAAIADKWLSQSDIDQVAAASKLPGAAVRAVYKVESAGSGFWGLRPKILFEGHVFWQRLKRRGKDPAKLAAGNENVLYPKWDRTKYAGGPGEYARLEQAQRIDSGAALESASWGLFQILGYHATNLGYERVETFVERMQANERAHLDAFSRFIDKQTFDGQPLAYWLRVCDWRRFARAYNGPGYAQNKYDEKLAAAYAAARDAEQKAEEVLALAA
jgi:N-acetylmuramidase/Putative peptidoglycan binding domain